MYKHIALNRPSRQECHSIVFPTALVASCVRIRYIWNTLFQERRLDHSVYFSLCEEQRDQETTTVDVELIERTEREREEGAAEQQHMQSKFQPVHSPFC